MLDLTRAVGQGAIVERAQHNTKKGILKYCDTVLIIFFTFYKTINYQLPHQIPLRNYQLPHRNYQLPHRDYQLPHRDYQLPQRD